MARCSYIIVLGFLGVMFLMQRGEATTFTVGGPKGWSVPSDNNNAYNQWAEKMRFQVGDSLLFVYQASSDSVLQVTKEDYTNCNTNSPLAKYNDGHTLIKFDHSGPYYFISGNQPNCNSNEKLVVVVLADRTTTTTKSPSPPPSPAPGPTTAVAGASPPSPTTTTTTEASPAPSAEATPPHKNGAMGSFVMGFGSLGAFVCSSMLLGF